MKKTECSGVQGKTSRHSRRLRGDVTAMAEVALRKSGMEGSDSNAMPIHMAELGSDNFEQEFTLGLMEAEEDTLDIDRRGSGAHRRGQLRALRPVRRSRSPKRA